MIRSLFKLTKTLVKPRTPIFTGVKRFSTSPELDEYLKNHSKLTEQVQELTAQFIDSLVAKKEDTGELLQKLLEVPVSISSEPLKKALAENIKNVPISSPTQVKNLISLFEKVQMEDFPTVIKPIDAELRHKIDQCDNETFAKLLFIYAESKVTGEGVWPSLYLTLEKKLKSLDINQLALILLGLVLHPQPNASLVKQIFEEVETKVEKASFIDVLRIATTISKRIIDPRSISPRIYGHLQSIFNKNIKYFDLYQVAQMFIVFIESGHLDDSIFPEIQEKIDRECFSRLDEIIEMETKGMDLKRLLIDLSTIAFNFSRCGKGSINFWEKYLETAWKLKEQLQIPSIKVNLFILTQINKNMLTTSKTIGVRTIDLLDFLVELVEKNDLVEKGHIDSFNMIILMTRFQKKNEKIWNGIVNKMISILHNPQTQLNFSMLVAIASKLSIYHQMCASEGKFLDEKAKFSNSYVAHWVEIWAKIEDNFEQIPAESIQPFEAASLVEDLSTIQLKIDRMWAKLEETIRKNINAFDLMTLLNILIGLLNKANSNESLINEVEAALISKISELDLKQLWKADVNLVKFKVMNGKIWQSIEKRVEELADQIDLNMFYELQVHFAIVDLKSKTIWQRFEKIALMNFDKLLSDPNNLVVTISAFEKVNCGSKLFWDKLVDKLESEVNNLNSEELGTILNSLRPELSNKLESPELWNKFYSALEANLKTANMNTIQNFKNSVVKNSIIKQEEKESLVRKIKAKEEQIVQEAKGEAI